MLHIYNLSLLAFLWRKRNPMLHLMLNASLYLIISPETDKIKIVCIVCQVKEKTIMKNKHLTDKSGIPMHSPCKVWLEGAWVLVLNWMTRI